MRIWLLALVAAIAFSGVARAQGGFPAANAGPDVTIACVGPNGAPIAMNGTGSAVDGNVVYLWTAPGVTFNDPTLLNPIGFFPVGVTVATLTVTFTDPATGTQFFNSDTVVVTVADTEPPIIYGMANPAVLWPPNHQMQQVNVDLLVYDRCSEGTPDVELISITSNEPDDGNGDGNTTGDIQGAEIGTDDRSFQLRAERAGPGNGRVYTATYRAWNQAGLASDATVLVIVPHDMGNGGVGSGDDDGWNDYEDQIKQDRKDAKKAAKAQLKAAKKAAKAGKKAYKAALKASR